MPLGPLPPSQYLEGRPFVSAPTARPPRSGELAEGYRALKGAVPVAEKHDKFPASAVRYEIQIVVPVEIAPPQYKSLDPNGRGAANTPALNVPSPLPVNNHTPKFRYRCNVGNAVIVEIADRETVHPLSATW